MSQLTSPTRVRKFLLETANKTRHRKFTRVSKETLDRIETATRTLCASIAHGAPSKGTTL